MEKKHKKISGLLIAFGAILVSLVMATSGKAASVDYQGNPTEATTEVGVKLVRNYQPEEMQPPVSVADKKAYQEAVASQPDSTHYGILPQTGAQQNSLLLLLGFLIIAAVTIFCIVKTIKQFKIREENERRGHV